MIPGALLQHSLRQGQWQAHQLNPCNKAWLTHAQRLVDTLATHANQPFGVVEETLLACNPQSSNQRTHKAMVHLLLADSTFSVPDGLNPSQLRETLFDAAITPWNTLAPSEDPLLAWQAVRQKLLETQAHASQCSSAQIEQALFADLPKQHLLTRMSPMDALALLFRYNSAQVQGLLTHASQMQLQSPWPKPRYLRQLMGWLRFFGLLFTPLTPNGSAVEHSTGNMIPKAESNIWEENPLWNAAQSNDANHPQDSTEPNAPPLVLMLNGPLDGLSKNVRYGLPLAQFFPALLLWPTPWQLQAKITVKQRSGQLTLQPSKQLRSHYPERGIWINQEIERFIDAFNQQARKAGRVKGHPKQAKSQLGLFGTHANQAAPAPSNRTDGWQAQAASDIWLLAHNRWLIPDIRCCHPEHTQAFFELLPKPHLQQATQCLANIAQSGVENYWLVCRSAPALASIKTHPHVLMYRRNFTPHAALQFLQYRVANLGR